MMVELKVGARFVDPELLTSPPHYRHHEVVAINGIESFEARHVYTGKLRRFPYSSDAVEKLQLVKHFPIMQSNLDGLVGDRVRVELVDGSTLTAVVTAVRYEKLKIDGAVFSYLGSIELDRSGATTYSPDKIKSIIRIGRAR